jgi:hypothetical protein
MSRVGMFNVHVGDVFMWETFFTQHYKDGCYISQVRDTATGRMLYTWNSADHEVFRRPAKSWRAAQIQITNYLKRKSKQKQSAAAQG